jgi:hypothetical protein
MYSTNQRSSWERVPIKAVAVTALVASGAVFYKAVVAEYGWVGACRYIWEGEAYSPQIQTILDSLNDVEAKRAAQEARLSGIEEALERARLDYVDDASEVRWLPATKDRATKAIVLRWVDYYKPRNLEITLGDLSAALDKLAATVDAVVLSGPDANSTTRVVGEIKRRKKVLSKQLVSNAHMPVYRPTDCQPRV